MAYEIIISAEAYLDINDASEWYDQQVSELGLDFLLELFEELNFISENRKLFAFISEPIRKKLMKRFPYAIYYSVLEDRKEILIEAIWHQKRSPSRLRRRLKK